MPDVANQLGAKFVDYTIAEYAEALITVKGKPFRFKIDEYDDIRQRHIKQDRSYLIPIYNFYRKYDIASRNMVLLCGRQTEKSTTCNNLIIILSAIIDGLETLCVFPRHKQLRIFSKQRFDDTVFSSPELMKFRWSTTTTWQEQMKKFTNKSIVNLNSAFKDAEGVRGASCQLLLVDELQSILQDCLHVIEEAQAHAEDDERISLYAATPLSKQNIAAREHSKTCQFEWLVKCDHCNAYNELTVEVIGPKFYMCKKCGRDIHPKDISKGLWVPKKPSLINVRWGFRIPQVMVPWKSHADMWQKLNDPHKTINQFNNECMGLPTDDGEELLSPAILKAACGKHNMMGPDQMRAEIHQTPVFQGTDWGTKSSGDANDRKSFSAVAIGAWVGGRFKFYYLEKFLGKKAKLSQAPMYVNNTARAYKVNIAANDYGFGAHANSELCETWDWQRAIGEGGPQDPVLMEMEMTGRMSKFGKFDADANRYRFDRNSALERFITAIKMQQVIFPKETIMFNAPVKNFEFSEDFLSVYREYNHEHGSYKYDHTKPDDVFMACLLCYFAGLQSMGMLLPRDRAKRKAIDALRREW